MTRKVNDLQKILLAAFLIRLCMLFIIYILSDNFEAGFIGSDNYYDDVRYEAGGEYYSQTALSPIDVDTFTKAYAAQGDWIGYKLLTPFISTPLWYWIVCIIMYFFKSKWIVRFFNVLVSSLAIVYVFKFAELVYDKNVAKRASSLLAILPYPVIFSCFSYKDQLVMLITFFLLYNAVKYKQTKKIKTIDIFKCFFSAVCLMLIRSGFSIILVVVCFLIALEPNRILRTKINRKLIIIIPIIFIILIFLAMKFSGNILYKMQYYFLRHEETLNNTSISIITVNGLKDIYKIPFTYVFSVIMPISLFGSVSSWYSIVSNLNIIMCPISIGATFNIFKKKHDKTVFWGCMGLYLITIITSINIFRHYYSLIPFSLIFYSDFREKCNFKEFRLYILLSILFISLLIIFYGRGW